MIVLGLFLITKTIFENERQSCKNERLWRFTLGKFKITLAPNGLTEKDRILCAPRAIFGKFRGKDKITVAYVQPDLSHMQGTPPPLIRLSLKTVKNTAF